ncbi:MAG TPA: hypothetical protein VFC18_15405 [Burkholderiales bacterium]|nr:hypothetical protein [Burkholderiales bacterium]
MEFIVWIVTGSLVGWLAHAVIGLNGERSRLVSMAMGVAGAVVGGKTLAPMFIVAPLDPISVTSLAFAGGAAATLLLLANVVQNRWNF